jgi:perosamine synthetase
MVLDEKVKFDAEEMMKRLSHLGVGTRPFFWGMHEQPVFNKMGWYGDEEYPVSSRIARRGFYIPSGLGITRYQQELVVQAVKKAIAS